MGRVKYQKTNILSNFRLRSFEGNKNGKCRDKDDKFVQTRRMQRRNYFPWSGKAKYNNEEPPRTWSWKWRLTELQKWREKKNWKRMNTRTFHRTKKPDHATVWLSSWQPSKRLKTRYLEKHGRRETTRDREPRTHRGEEKRVEQERETQRDLARKWKIPGQKRQPNKTINGNEFSRF